MIASCIKDRCWAIAGIACLLPILASLGVAAEPPMKIQTRVGIVKTTPIKLGAGPTQVKLEPVPSKKDEAALPLRARVKALPAEHHLYLVAKDLRTDVQPGVLYHVYLDLPAKASKKQMEAHHVGHLNFFAAPVKGGKGFVSFDITQLAKDLHAKDLLKETTTLTFLPAGEPGADAHPMIGEVSLTEQ
jgi:tyrosinase